jgi:hypothetical protein
VVSTARNEPLRYGKNGELLIDYEETEEHKEHFRRRSVASQGGKPAVEHVAGRHLSRRETSSSEGERNLSREGV